MKQFINFKFNNRCKVIIVKLIKNQDLFCLSVIFQKIFYLLFNIIINYILNLGKISLLTDSCILLIASMK